MGFISWIVVGAIAGFLASLISGSRESLIMMVVLGIVGAVVGGWVAGNLLHIANVTGVNATSVIVAVVGALIVIFVVGSMGGKRRSFGWR